MTSEEIKINCVQDESINIIEVHELIEKNSSLLVLEPRVKSNEAVCENIIINGNKRMENVTLGSVKYGNRTEKEDTLFQCFYCGLRCSNLSQLRIHVKVHSLSNPFEKSNIGYECITYQNTCDYKSSEEDGIEEPFSIPDETLSFVCPQCKWTTSTKASFHEHLRSHCQTPYFMCSYCTFKCEKLRYLKAHVKYVHSNRKPFECSSCDFRCERKVDLIKHRTKHSFRKPFKCDHCYFRSKSIQYLKTHLLSHNVTKPFHCAVCSYKCTTKLLLKDHYINYHTQERPFVCSFCTLSFNRNGSLKRHILTHMENRPFACHLCNYNCSRKDNLKSHINSIHSDMKPFTCISCSYSCKYRIMLRNHMSVHSLSNSYVCDKCSYRFDSEAKLKRHTSSHSVGKDIKCPYCLFKTKAKINLQNHLKLCRRIMSCSECDFCCKRSITLRKHFVQQHLDPALPYHCPQCSLKFRHELYYNLHITSHDSKTLYKCLYCFYGTDIKETFMKHVDSHAYNHTFEGKKACHLNIHIKESDENTIPKTEIVPASISFDRKSDVADMKIFEINYSETDKELGLIEEAPPLENLFEALNSEDSICNDNFLTSASNYYTKHIDKFKIKSLSKQRCPVCDELFYKKTDLKDHLALQHSFYRPYKCDHCERKFKIKANLKQHLVVHSEEKPFHCTKCDYKSKLPETLRRHYVTHSTEKPYQCSLCKYSCKLKEKLKRHMIVHSDDRPFHCLRCSYTSKSKELLKKHSVIHSREEDEAT